MGVKVLVRAAFLAVFAAGGVAPGFELPAGTQTAPAVDLAKSISVVGPANFRLNLHLAEVVTGKVPLNGYISVVNGVVVHGYGSSSHNRGRHVVEGTNVVFDGTRLAGSLKITIKADPWVPRDGKDRIVECRIEGQLAADGGGAGPAEAWKAVAASNGAGFTITGKAVCTNAEGGAEFESPMNGTLSPAAGGNRWNMGTWEDGVRQRFDMGTNRVNWNNVRMAEMGMEPVRNWKAYDGLRVQLTTASPRRDAEVSLWLREADGSWYYYCSAVPLTATTNTAILYFGDFEEAEWVSPENHMDEDFVLDLATVSHLGVGIVNPLGVGVVEFKLTALDLFKVPAAEPAPAEVRVTGKMLSVNGHEVVPAGLFGGFAHDLPAKYRPGCQRAIRSRPGGGPTVLRNGFAQIRWVANANQLFKRLSTATEGTLDHHLWKILQHPSMKARADGILVETKDAKQVEERNSTAAQLFRTLQSWRTLYDESVWKGVDLPSSLREQAGRLAADDTRQWERLLIGRKLLAAAYPGHIEALLADEPFELFQIDCMGDRRESSTFLDGASWEKNMQNLGASYARAAKAEGIIAVMEWWNEPYLDWAGKNGFNLRAEYFRQDLATEGGPVVPKWGAEKDAIPHLKWKSRRYTDKVSKEEKQEWRVYDETAFTYWSGRGNGYMYDRTFEAVAKAAKEVNPDVQMVAGWGCRWNEDHWAMWDILYKPTIDRGIQWMDGVNEHHYMGDPTAMPGAYEAVVAYTVSKYGKWIYGYNTECGELVDVPARGVVTTPELVAASKDYRVATYSLRDIVYSVCQTPDKVRSRTVIHNQHTPVATEICYGMLSNLRGRLVVSESSDPKVWCAVSVDGTDPRAMPPKPGLTLVAVLFNDHRSPRKVRLSVAAPTGTSMRGGTAEFAWRDGTSLEFAAKQTAVEAKDNAYATELVIPGRAAWKAAFPLEGKVAAAAQVTRKQFFADDVVKVVETDNPWKTMVKIDQQALRGCRRAWLRVVVESVSEGEALVRVGDVSLTLPRAPTRDNGNRILEVPLDPGKLVAETPVVFSVADGGHAGYRADMASIVLESVTE